MEIPSRNIIFLQGIFFDKVKTIEDRMISESQNCSNDDIISHTINNIAIPSKFKNIKSWKEITKNLQLKCWYCNLSFMGVSCFIPKQVRSGLHGKEFDTHGWFCGFACAYAYINNNSEYRINKTHFDKINMLKMLFLSFYKRKIKELYEAPNKYSLTMYGGYLDLNEYKSQLKIINQKILSESIPITQ